jgi:hypothetical protein
LDLFFHGFLLWIGRCGQIGRLYGQTTPDFVLKRLKKDLKGPSNYLYQDFEAICRPEREGVKKVGIEALPTLGDQLVTDKTFYVIECEAEGEWACSHYHAIGT